MCDTSYQPLSVTPPLFEHVEQAVLLLQTLSETLDTQPNLFDTIWSDYDHAPDQPHHFLTKYKQDFGGNIADFWNYLDTPNKRILYSWCMQSLLVFQEQNWSCETFHSAVCLFFIITRELSQVDCRCIWGVERGHSLFQDFEACSRNPVSFYNVLCSRERHALYSWSLFLLPQHFPL